MKTSFRIMDIFKCQRGVSAIEFALALPLLVVTLLGGFEVSRYVILHQKLEKIAYTIADVVSQSDIVTIAQLDQAVLAAGEIMNPYNFSESGVVIVSSVQQAEDSAAIVRWQFRGGGDWERTSAVGLEGEEAVLPGSLAINDGDNVIIAEVFFRYAPLFSGGVFADFEDIYKVTIFKPRLGALTTPPA